MKQELFENFVRDTRALIREDARDQFEKLVESTRNRFESELPTAKKTNPVNAFMASAKKIIPG